ncbi:MAG: MBL fold metallo-hydrolase [Comamonas sp.]|nr:MBL fold metallo-hydrolase [Comamonas sp.]
MSKTFASHADLAEKKISFERLSDNAYAYTAEGDPNSGVIIGDDSVMVIDTTATPAMAQGLIQAIRSVTDKPIRHVVLTHYHAVRVLGASAYAAEGGVNVFASRGTHELIVERGQADMDSEIGRFPRLFQGADGIPGLTWPTVVFERELTLYLGKLEVRLMHLGAGHTKGDSIVWIPSQGICFSGDLVEFNAGVYTGDAHLAQWPATLDALAALKPQQLVPGRGPALKTPQESQAGIAYTRRWVSTLYACAQQGVSQGKSLREVYADTRKAMDPDFGQVFIYEHCIPFDVSRAYDEASGIAVPRVWTAERDREMWAALND